MVHFTSLSWLLFDHFFVDKPWMKLRNRIMVYWSVSRDFRMRLPIATSVALNWRVSSVNPTQSVYFIITNIMQSMYRNANTVRYQKICVCSFRCWCRDKRESRTLTKTFRRSAQRNSCCTSESRNCLDRWPISRPRNLRWSALLSDLRRTSLPWRRRWTKYESCIFVNI